MLRQRAKKQVLVSITSSPMVYASEEANSKALEGFRL